MVARKDDGETERTAFLTLTHDMAFEADCVMRARAADPIMAKGVIAPATAGWICAGKTGLDIKKHLAREASIDSRSCRLRCPPMAQFQLPARRSEYLIETY